VSNDGDGEDGFFEAVETDRPDTEVVLRRVYEVVETARPIPLSATVRLENKEEVLELLGDAIERLPDELRQARWLLKERQEYLAKAQREAADIVEAARARAERMVQRTEIVREAQATARRTVETADDEARRLRHEAEDYCDQKLAAMEIVLERTMKTVVAGREKLRVTPSPMPAAGGPDDLAEDDEAAAEFFDQDAG
jgi:hypothetical protein